jgi:hypothetical protein
MNYQKKILFYDIYKKDSSIEINIKLDNYNKEVHGMHPADFFLNCRVHLMILSHLNVVRNT